MFSQGETLVNLIQIQLTEHESLECALAAVFKIDTDASASIASPKQDDRQDRII